MSTGFVDSVHFVSKPGSRPSAAALEECFRDIVHPSIGTSMTSEEHQLIRAVGLGDRAAFEKLVLRYQTPVFSFVYRYLGDRFAAEDLVQEVFLRVHQAAQRFEPRGSVSSWIFKIAYNLSVNELKRRARAARFSADLKLADRGNRTGTAHSMLEEKEIEVRLMNALEELPENQRAALLLRIKEGLSYVEISRVLSVSVSSVESLIFRGRERLRDKFRDYMEDRCNVP
jgi:RNA polymerase sigma-70 factor (ECF subfamily)